MKTTIALSIIVALFAGTVWACPCSYVKRKGEREIENNKHGDAHQIGQE